MEFRSEIKLFLIVAAISAVLAVAGILLLKSMQPVAPAAGPAPAPQTPPPAPTPVPSPQPQMPDTAEWQTYRNAEFGFEVQYPPGGEVAYTGRSTTTGYNAQINLPYEEGTNVYRKYLEVTIHDTPPYSFPTEEIVVNENTFLKKNLYGADRSGVYQNELYTINHNGKIYLLDFSLWAGSLATDFNKEKELAMAILKKESAIFDQILSTFRFTP